MKEPTINPEWRTSTVVALCQSMREAQDFGAMPILADALQDADCDDEELLGTLRAGSQGYSCDAALVACVWSDKGEEAVRWLMNFADVNDCPRFDVLFAGATGNHHENARPQDDPEDYDGYYNSRNEDGYLHFGGTDAHGSIPAVFWDYVILASGKPIPGSERAEYFSCSC